MQIYLDTGNVDEIREAASYGILDGVTTNPSLIAKEGRDFESIVREIVGILKPYSEDFTVSAEVTALTADEMVAQGVHLSQIDPDHILVKVPLIPEGIKATYLLAKQGIRTNVTLCFSPAQALLAAKAGAYVVSPFIGRLDDINHTGMDLVASINDIFDTYDFDTGVLAASIRSPLHVSQAAKAGADIATIPFGIFKKLFNHPLTDIGLQKFMDDWKKFQQGQQ